MIVSALNFRASRSLRRKSESGGGGGGGFLKKKKVDEPIAEISQRTRF